MKTWLDRLRDFFETPDRAAYRAQQLKVKLDAELFMNLCKTLYAEAPKGSALLVMEARLPVREEDGKADMECYVKKSSGKNAKYVPGQEAENKLWGWLRELRESMVAQKQPAWKGIKLVVDVPGDKYNADFKY